MSDFMLIHGAWHGGAHWGALTSELVARGHQVVAPDLPGHGIRARFPAAYLSQDAEQLATERSPIADVTLDVAAQAVVDLLGTWRRRPIVVAHSMGGAIVTRAAELAPELIGQLVYVAAFVPTQLATAGAYLALPQARTVLGSGLYLGDPSQTGAVRINPRSIDPGYLEELHDAYFGDLGREEFLAYALTLTPDQPVSFLASETGATAARWGRIPRAYIRTSKDRALPIELQDVMIRQADELAPATAFARATIDTGHAPFGSRPAQLADVLESLIVSDLS
ncbi:alpha/beta hydrolase [Kribbella sp. NPDC004875]|uniref:alpha/beta hydrolase n=1 Tax=Kribbella sp. NPDC004875 TaxID=3364107 RepID=UPI0036A85396